MSRIQCASRKSRNQAVHLRLAALYNLAGYKDRAALEYNEFLKKKPNYPEAQKLRNDITANGPISKPKTEANPGASPNP